VAIFMSSSSLAVVLLTAVASLLTQAPTPAEREAASKSPQAAAVLANQKAVATGDLEAYQKTVISDVAKTFDGPSGKTLWKMLSQATPTTDLEFLRVTTKGNTATLVARGKREGVPQRGEITLQLEGGQWKVGVARWEPAK
jgi:hypothetical protein